MIRRALLMAAAAAAVIGLGACYYDDNCRYCGNDLETIRFENHTNRLWDNFIDGNYVGTVSSFGRLEFDGDYEGRHVFESKSTDNQLHIGPREIRIFNGDLIILDITDNGFKVSQSQK